MSGDTLTIILVAAAAVAIVAIVVGVMILVRRRNERQMRLEKAFERARDVRHSGSGLQGTPYSVYGETSWSDHSSRHD